MELQYHMELQNSSISEKIQSDSKLSLKFQFIKKIGCGCFGTVYQAINRKNNRNVAIKLQVLDKSHQNAKSSLFNEITILDKLKGVQGIPKIYSVGKWRYGIFMEMQMLVSSLNEERNREFLSSEIRALTIQMLQILKRVHQKGIIHQDLKPQNIMRNQSGNLVLIDFGLSTFFNTKLVSQSLSNTFFSLNQKKGFIGTPRYASLASHKGLTQLPKDDIESLLYVVGSLYLKKATWFNLKAPVNERLEMIGKYKKLTNKQWFRRCGKPFIKTYEYLLEIGDHKFPQYNHIISFFNRRETVKLSSNLPEQINKNRRRSEPVNKIQGDPVIHIHYVEKRDKEQKSADEIREDPSYSEMAQNGLEMMQLLTQKLLKFNNQQDPQIETAEGSFQIAITDHQPKIQDLAKYKNIDFKNPFKV